MISRRTFYFVNVTKEKYIKEWRTNIKTKIILTYARTSRDKGLRTYLWKGWGLMCGQYSRNEWCIASFTTTLKLENKLLVWIEPRKGGIISKGWIWDYIGRPALWLERTWVYTGRFDHWYWNKWVLMAFNLKMKDMCSTLWVEVEGWMLVVINSTQMSWKLNIEYWILNIEYSI